MTDNENPTSKQNYLLAIDGGGTKTEICLFNLLTEKSHSCFRGGANYKSLGLHNVRENLLGGIENILTTSSITADNIALCLIGVSGCDTDEDKHIYEKMLAESGIAQSRIMICNDSEMIFRALAKEPGLCIVAGTGSIVFGFAEDGIIFRAGGWGSPLSDLGSGYWIGAEILKRYLNWIDGVGEWDAAFSEIEKKYPDQNSHDIAAKLACLDLSEVAAFARTVIDTAINGNLLCQTIVNNAADIVSQLAIAVLEKLSVQNNSQISIIEVGSLFLDKAFEKHIQQRIQSSATSANISFKKTIGTPAQSGILYAEKIYKDRLKENSK